MSGVLKYGKLHYYEIQADDTEYDCLYSTDDVKILLERKFLHQKLIQIYVSLDGYLEALHNNEYIIDLTYLGGETLLVFEHECIHLFFHGEGMLRCRCSPVWKLKMQHRFDYPPDAMFNSDRYFYNASEHFILPFENQIVRAISVTGTNTWSFSQSWFDEEKAAQYADKNKLPNCIKFILENGNTVCLTGDSLEYYSLEVAPQDKFK